jgi:hypothetical protein
MLVFRFSVISYIMFLQEFCNLCNPESVTGMIILQKKILEWANADWTGMPTMGASYSKQVQKDVSYQLLTFLADMKSTSLK